MDLLTLALAKALSDGGGGGTGTPFPECDEQTNGNYLLHAAVSGGVASYDWNPYQAPSEFPGWVGNEDDNYILVAVVSDGDPVYIWDKYVSAAPAIYDSYTSGASLASYDNRIFIITASSDLSIGAGNMSQLYGVHFIITTTAAITLTLDQSYTVVCDPDGWTSAACNSGDVFEVALFRNNAIVVRTKNNSANRSIKFELPDKEEEQEDYEKGEEVTRK